MAVENDLKEYIRGKYHSIRAFSEDSGIPYSTVDSIFKRGISNSSVATIIKVCHVLDLDADALGNGEVKTKQPAAESNGLNDIDQELMELLQQLTPEQWVRVNDFVKGLLASR